MVAVTTRSTAEFGLRSPGRSVHCPARRTGLRAIVRRHFDELTASPCELVAKALHQPSPTRVEDAAGQTTIGLDHPRRVQLFDHHCAVVLGVDVAESLNHVLALPTHLTVQSGHTKLGLISIVRPFLSPRDGPLCASEPLQRPLVVTRGRCDFSIRVSNDVDDSTVEGDDGACSRKGIGNFALTNKRRKPLVPLPTQRARLGCSLGRAVQHHTQVSKLRKAQYAATKTPDLRMRFCQPEKVAPFALPARLPTETLEATLPGLIKLDQQLRADIARDIAKPHKFRSQRFELPDLLERRVVATLVPWTSQPKTTLLVRQVPQVAQRRLPLQQPRLLIACRVHAKAVCLANDHSLDHSLACDQNKRLSRWKTSVVCTSCALGLRSQVSACRVHREGIPSLARELGAGLQRLRVRASRNGLGARSRPLARRIPAQGRTLTVDQLPQGSQRAQGTCRESSRGQRQALGRAVLVAELLRGVMWSSPARDRRTLRRETARRGFLLALEDGIFPWSFAHE
ncbi:MAG: hypothetical protein RLZZ450_2377 [Pseudomonadota bacterium]